MIFKARLDDLFKLIIFSPFPLHNILKTAIFFVFVLKQEIASVLQPFLIHFFHLLSL